MENNSQQPVNGVVPPVNQGSPQNTTQSPGEAQPAPVKKPINYLGTAYGLLILLAIFLPSSSFAVMLAYPIWILGLIAGIKYFIDAIKTSKTKSGIVRSFVILGGIGVGILIFIGSFIAGSVIATIKNPDPS